DPRGPDLRDATGLSDRSGFTVGNAANAATSGPAQNSLFDRARSQIFSALFNLGGDIANAFDLQSLSGRSSAPAGGSEARSVPDSGTRQNSPYPSTTMPTTTPGGAGIDEVVSRPSPLSGVLSALGAGGLRALEQAMRDFLQQVERIGQPLDD